MSRIIGIGIGLGFTYGGAGGSVINPTLAAPTLVWDEHILDLLPDFTIAFEAQVADIVTLRRSTASDFGTYEEVSDTVDSIDPANTLEFDFGGDWATGTWYVKAYYTRSGVVSSLSATETLVLEVQGMDIDFRNNVAFVVDTGTPANDYDGTPGGLLTETVDADGTYINSSGVITQKTANTIHIDYDPTTLLPLGIPIWEARTNVLLNSAINGTSLATQSVNVTVQAYTLSFYGTGTITLSGASTAGPLVGTGAYPTRVSLTFTPSAASLTLTVSGSVQYAQLEAGSFETPFIPTAGSSVARAADTISILTTAFPHSATEWTTIVEAIPGPMVMANDGLNRATHALSNNGFNESNYVVRPPNSAALSYGLIDGGGGQNSAVTASITPLTAFKTAFAVKANDVAVCLNGGTVGTDTSATLPTVDRLYIGSNWAGSGLHWCGHIRKIAYVPRRMTNTEIQAMTA